MIIDPSILVLNCITPLWSCLFMCTYMNRSTLETISDYAINQPMVFSQPTTMMEVLELYHEEDLI